MVKTEPARHASCTTDWSEVFDDSYLYFYEPRTDDARTRVDVETIWRVLALQPGQQLLDLACGTGRVARALAERGCMVTGLDACDDFLERARAEASTLPLSYVRGTMSALPWSEQFDHVVSWLSSFGYLGDELDRTVLREVRRALRGGGRLLIETVHRDFVLRSFAPQRVLERGDDFMINQQDYEPLTGRIHTQRTVLRDGKVRRFHFSMRLFGFPELRDWLLQAGFARVEAFDGEGLPLCWDSPRMIVVAQK